MRTDRAKLNANPGKHMVQVRPLGFFTVGVVTQALRLDLACDAVKRVQDDRS
jgi:hypothetical protein